MGAEAQGRFVLKVSRQTQAKILRSGHYELLKTTVEVFRCGFADYCTDSHLYLEGRALYPHAQVDADESRYAHTRWSEKVPERLKDLVDEKQVGRERLERAGGKYLNPRQKTHTC